MAKFRPVSKKSAATKINLFSPLVFTTINSLFESVKTKHIILRKHLHGCFYLFRAVYSNGHGVNGKMIRKINNRIIRIKCIE